MIRFCRAVFIVFLLMFPFGESIVSTPYFNNTTLKLSNDTISGVYIEDHTSQNTDGTEKTYLQSELGTFNSNYQKMNDTGYIQIGNFGSKSNLIVRAKDYSHFENTNCQNSANRVGEPEPDYEPTCNTVEEVCICAKATYQGYIGLSPSAIKDFTYTTLTLKDTPPTGTTHPTKTIMLNFETHSHIQINAFNQDIDENKSVTLNIKANNKPLYFPRHEGALPGARFASCLHSDGANLEIQDSKLISTCTDQTNVPEHFISDGALQFDSINATFGNISESNSEIDDGLNTDYVRLHFGLVEVSNNIDISITLNHTLDATQTETHRYSKKGPDETGYINILSFTATANTSTTVSAFKANIGTVTPAGTSTVITNIIIDIPGEIHDCTSKTQGNTITCE
jgi:hypothetical protein